ncbi:hypothetical protein [Eubacterium sp. F2]|jgi:hypothetical protein|uniref:hypothetical protein n=1 Tax=Eubacterium sp. F2 TaxID=3381348 RepID=UPI003907F73D
MQGIILKEKLTAPELRMGGYENTYANPYIFLAEMRINIQHGKVIWKSFWGAGQRKFAHIQPEENRCKDFCSIEIDLLPRQK